MWHCMDVDVALYRCCGTVWMMMWHCMDDDVALYG
jgi:hypothetical protein